MNYLADWSPFKTNSYPNDGLKLYSETGKMLNAIFVRVADGKTWHIAFHLKPDMVKLLSMLASLGLVKNPVVRERVGKKPWI
jgi:hypothetical protein